MMVTVDNYLDRLRACLELFPKARVCELVSILAKCRDKGGTIFTMGNGGSGATASHFVCDINKGTSVDGIARFRAICLNDNMPTLLAYANDVGYDDIFVEQLHNFLEPADVVIGFSGSGNSANVLKAVDFANQWGALTVGITGFDGGQLAKKVALPLVIEIDDMQVVEDMHLMVAHILMQCLVGIDSLVEVADV
jgi:D-sedoheptulose 7-phosphate isomerase